MNEQTQELIRYRLERSQASLRAAQSLHSQGHYLDAINRLYLAKAEDFIKILESLINTELSTINDQ